MLNTKCVKCEELKLKCATLEHQYVKLRDEYNELVFANNELEQQLNDEKGICEALRSQNSDAVEEVQKLEQQIQQAEKRGYELAESHMHVTINYCDSELRTYEQAIAKRDGGEKKE